MCSQWSFAWSAECRPRCHSVVGLPRLLAKLRHGEPWLAAERSPPAGSLVGRRPVQRSDGGDDPRLVLFAEARSLGLAEASQGDRSEREVPAAGLGGLEPQGEV